MFTFETRLNDRLKNLHMKLAMGSKQELPTPSKSEHISGTESPSSSSETDFTDYVLDLPTKSRSVITGIHGIA